MTRTVHCQNGHRREGEDVLCPVCGTEGKRIELSLADESHLSDDLHGEGFDAQTREQQLGFSVSPLGDQSWRRTPEGASVSSLRREWAPRSEIEKATCQRAVALMAEELEAALEYRPPTTEEDQSGADGFARHVPSGPKALRHRPREVPLQVIHSNEEGAAALGRQGRFDSETTFDQLLDATLKMIDLKFRKGHDLAQTVLLLRAATELPGKVVSRLTLELTKAARPCLGVVYVPNAGAATAVQRLDRALLGELLGLDTER